MKKKDEEYSLFYWQGMGGKGTVIRMCLELCELKWKEALEGKDASKDGIEIKGANIKGYPNFAYPILKHKDVVILSCLLNEYCTTYSRTHSLGCLGCLGCLG